FRPQQEGMGVEIRIGSYVTASFLLEREPNQWHALVVLDSGNEATDFVKAHACSHLYLRFDDIEEPVRTSSHRPRPRLPRHSSSPKGKISCSCVAVPDRGAVWPWPI